MSERLPRKYVRALRAAGRAGRVPVVARRHDVECDELTAAGVVLTNPSILTDGDRRVVLVREIAPDPTAPPPAPGTAPASLSHTWLYESSGPEPLAGTGSRLSEEHVGPLAGPTGLEDPRAFMLDGRLWALWVTGERADGVPGGYRNRIVLGEVTDRAVRVDAVLPSPRDREREKNWMPFTAEGALHVMYDISLMEVYRVEGGRLEQVHCLSEPIPALPGLSGSSQLVPWGDGDWLCVCHRAMRRKPVRFVPTVFYVHHLVLLTREFELRRMSAPFFLSRRGVEFCAGLAVAGDRVFLSYGVADNRAMLMTLSREQFESLLAPRT